MKKILFITEVSFNEHKTLCDCFDGVVKIIPNTTEWMLSSEEGIRTMQALRAIGVDKMPCVILLPDGKNNALDLIQQHTKGVANER